MEKNIFPQGIKPDKNFINPLLTPAAEKEPATTNAPPDSASVLSGFVHTPKCQVYGNTNNMYGSWKTKNKKRRNPPKIKAAFFSFFFNKMQTERTINIAPVTFAQTSVAGSHGGQSGMITGRKSS